MYSHWYYQPSKIYRAEASGVSEQKILLAAWKKLLPSSSHHAVFTNEALESKEGSITITSSMDKIPSCSSPPSLPF
jgi:hypothetical protein